MTDQPETEAGRALAAEPDAGYDRHERVRAILAIEAQARSTERQRVVALEDALRDGIEALRLVKEHVGDWTERARARLNSPEPHPAPLDVERLVEAWANVMDDTVTADDWAAIAAEYARLARG